MSYTYRYEEHSSIPVSFGALSECECVKDKGTDQEKKESFFVPDKKCTNEECDELCKKRDEEYTGTCIGKQKSD